MRVERRVELGESKLNLMGTESISTTGLHERLALSFQTLGETQKPSNWTLSRGPPCRDCIHLSSHIFFFSVQHTNWNRVSFAAITSNPKLIGASCLTLLDCFALWTLCPIITLVLSMRIQGNIPITFWAQGERKRTVPKSKMTYKVSVQI